MDNKKQYNILIAISLLLVLVGVSLLLSESLVPKNPNHPLPGQTWYAHLPLLQQYYFSVAGILFLLLPITTIVTGVFIWQRSKLEGAKKKTIIATAGILLVLIALGISIAWWIAASNA